MNLIDKNRSTLPIAIIGGGFAGAAAAVELVSQGKQIILFEAGKTAGGRARGIAYRELMLDNGLHILIGAYRQTLALMARVGVSESAALLRTPLHLALHGELSLIAKPLPAPFHLLFASAQGFSISEKLALARLLLAARKPHSAQHNESVADWLARAKQPRRLTQLLWEPLCVATLNTPIDLADAGIFAQVLRDSLLAKATDADLLLPKVDLSALLPEPALRWCTARGAQCERQTRVDAIAPTHQGFALTVGARNIAVQSIVLATGPREASALLAPLEGSAATCDTLAALTYQPIHSIYLQFPPQRASAVPTLRAFPMQGLANATAQWVFDRGQLAGQQGLLGVVVSASTPLKDRDSPELIATIAREITPLLAGFGIAPNSAPVWSKVIQEKFATFSCNVGVRRPSVASGVSGIWLAGDYVAGPYPATLEGAVQSGLAAAQAALAANHDSAH